MPWPIRSISLGVHGPWLALFWLALGIALTLAVWAYRAPVPPLPRAYRIVLGLLRFTALGLLILVLFQPVVTVAARGDDKPLLPVLLDTSSSMNLPSRAGVGDSTTRLAVAEEVLDRLLPDLRRDFDVQLYGFSTGVEQLAPAGAGDRLAVPARGAATSLGPALAEVLARPGRRPSALLLMSDGAANSGSDPLAAAERLGVPILAVPASLDSTVEDVWVAECLANRTAYLGQETVVSVTLGSELPVATRVGVILREDDRVITREFVTLPAGAGRVPVEIRFRPDRLGLHRYAAEVEQVSGELTSENNARAFAIEVHEERLQVLVIADRVSWDATFIRRALASDRTLSTTAIVRLDPRSPDFKVVGVGRLGGLPTRAAELAPFGAVVLVGVDPGRLPAQSRDALISFAREGGGLLAVAGSTADAFRGFNAAGSAFGSLFPARPAPGGPPGELVTCALTAAGASHPVTSLGESPTRASQLWSELPPVRSGEMLEATLAGEVLVEGRGARTLVPLVIAGRTAGGRILVVNAALVWRWGFLVPGVQSEDAVHRRFWGEAVRWLAEGRGGGNLELFADQSVFLGGKRVTIGARLTDEQLKPVDDAQVAVEVVPDAGGQPLAVQLVPGEGRGQYAGEAGFLAAGLYRLKGTAVRGKSRWSGEGDHFLVDHASLEGTTPAANPDLLRRLAARTGGALVDPAEARTSIRSVVASRVSAARAVEVKLWNHAGMFIAFVSCVSLEWFLRRRRGLA